MKMERNSVPTSACLLQDWTISVTCCLEDGLRLVTCSCMSKLSSPVCLYIYFLNALHLDVECGLLV